MEATISQKRNKIRNYAKKLKVCTTCLQKEARKDKNTCDYCSDANKKFAKIKRNKPENCSRCGCKRDNKNLKTCSKCRK